MSNSRLPQNIIPESYEISIKTDIKSKKFDAQEIISFKEIQKSDRTELHCDDSIKIASVTQGEHELKFTHNNNRLEIFGDGIEKSPVLIKYQGSLDHPNTGFYYIDDTTASTQLEATHARDVFPCFDEPCVKSTFKLTITAPKDLSVYSNTPSESTSIDGEFKTTVFQRTPKMCSYLIGIVVGTFIQVSGKTKSGVDVVVAAIPEKKEYIEEPLKECIKYIEWYEEFTQVHFPLPSLQVIAVPDFIMGAMENFGIVIARESCSLGNTKLGSKNGFAKPMKVNAHEIAHQWAGDCVSPKWWDSIWLNEGFATIFPSLVFQDIHPDWEFWSIFFTTDLKNGLELDQSTKTHPIHTVCNSEAEIEGSFDYITYSKAGLFIRMLMFHVGYEKFREALRVYFKRFMYSNADTEDIKKCFTEVLKQDLNPFFNCWTLKAGYPLITLNEDGTLVQKRFTVNGLQDDKWIVPLFIAIGRKDGTVEEMKVVMEDETMKLDIKGEYEWIKLNTGIKSLCRTIVKGKYLDMLIEAIHANKVSSEDMFSALYDEFECAKIGIVSFKDLIKLLKAYEGCDKALPAKQASDVLSYFYDEFPGLRAEISAFAKPFYESIINKIGMESKPTDSLPLTVARDEILKKLAFKFNGEEALNYGKKLYKKYLERGDYCLPEDTDPELVTFMLFCGSYSFEEGYKFNRQAALHSPNPEVAAYSVSSLGYISKERLPVVLDAIETLKKQNIHTVFNNCCHGPSACIEIWEYFKKKLPFFLSLFKQTSFILPSMTESVIRLAQNEEQLADMEHFFKENPIEIAASSINGAIEAMHARLERQKLYGEEVKDAFTSSN